MEELDAMFADGEALTREQFNERLNASGMKLADLAKGGYVAKEKYEKLESGVAASKAAAQAQAEQYKDYDSVKRENESLKAQLRDIGYRKEIAGAQVDPAFEDFVLYTAKQGMTDKTDFKASLGAFLEANPQYLKAGAPKPVVTIASGVEVARGGGAKDPSKMSMEEYVKFRQGSKK